MFKSLLATTILLTTPAVTTSLISTTVIVQAQTQSCTDYGTFIQCTDGTYCTKFGNTTQCSGSNNNNGSNILSPIKPITPNNSGIGKALDNSAKINRLSRPQYRPVRPRQPSGLVTSQEVDWRWEMKCKKRFSGTFRSLQVSTKNYRELHDFVEDKNAFSGHGSLKINGGSAILHASLNGEKLFLTGSILDRQHKLKLRNKNCTMTAYATRIGQIVQR